MKTQIIKFYRINFPSTKEDIYIPVSEFKDRDIEINETLLQDDNFIIDLQDYLEFDVNKYVQFVSRRNLEHFIFEVDFYVEYEEAYYFNREGKFIRYGVSFVENEFHFSIFQVHESSIVELDRINKIHFKSDYECLNSITDYEFFGEYERVLNNFKKKYYKKLIR